MKTEQRPVLAFDVYGTLIDFTNMEAHLRPFFNDKAREASELWRTKQIEYSFRRALMQKYEDFNVCTAQALSYVAMQFGVSLPDSFRQSLLEQYGRLPAFPDAAAALQKLHERGFNLVACSNGTEEAVRGLLDRAGMLARFRDIVSVSEVRTFKPSPAVYEYLTKRVRTPRDSVWLISSNPFDVIGAKACGLPVAWVRRDAKRVFDPWGFSPDVVVSSLDELPAKFIQTA